MDICIDVWPTVATKQFLAPNNSLPSVVIDRKATPTKTISPFQYSTRGVEPPQKNIWKTHFKCFHPTCSMMGGSWRRFWSLSSDSIIKIESEPYGNSIFYSISHVWLRKKKKERKKEMG